MLRTSIGDRPPFPQATVSTPGGAGGMAARRMKPTLKLKDIAGVSTGALGAGLGAGRPMDLPADKRGPAQGELGTPFANFQKIVCAMPRSDDIHARLPLLGLYCICSDPSGVLNFSGKAILHSKGVDFTSGVSYNINMTQFELQDELGKGNYGTVRKVLHKPTNVIMAMKVSNCRPYHTSTLSCHYRKSDWY